MSKVKTVCPHCRESSDLEKSYIDRFGLQDIPCPYCLKNLGADLNASGSLGSLAKSAPDGMAEVNRQLAELRKVVDAYLARTPARFQPQGEEAPTPTVLKFVAGMPGGLMLESDITDAVEASRQQSTFVTKAANGDAVAQAELQKALANGKPVTSPNYTRVGDGLEKDARSTTITERTAPTTTTRRSFQHLSD